MLLGRHLARGHLLDDLSVPILILWGCCSHRSMNHTSRKPALCPKHSCLLVIQEKKKMNYCIWDVYFGGLVVTRAWISQANHLQWKSSVSLWQRECCRKEETFPRWGHGSIWGRNRNINSVTNSLGQFTTDNVGTDKDCSLIYSRTAVWL